MASASRPARLNSAAILDTTDVVWEEVQTKAEGPQGSLPLTDEMLRNWPSGDLFGLSQNAGMGWEPAGVARDPFLILSTQGGLCAPRWHADRARLSHRALGDRPARSGGGRGTEAARRGSVRGHGLRPLRRPDPGHGRDDGQPSLPQRRRHRLPPPDPFAASPQGGPRRRHLRQGTAGHDDGSGGLAKICPACSCPAA